MQAVTPAQLKEIRDIAQSAVHQARAESQHTPRDHWRGVAYKLGRIVLSLTATPQSKQVTQ